MAIFSSSRKDKHKKNTSGGGDSSSASSPPIGSTNSANGSFPRSGSGLGGSVGRSEGSGIPLPGGGGGMGGGSIGPSSSALYGSTSSQGPGGAPPALGPGIPQPAHMQQSLSHPGHLPSSTSAPHPPSHTVLYPWSQRPLSLLPSQLLPPPTSTNTPSSPSLAAEPVLGHTSPLPFPRYGHSVNPVASSSGDLYIFGGLVQNTVKNDLYVVHCAPAVAAAAAGQPSSPLQVALLETRGEVPGPRVGHASVSVGNVLIVWGGDTKTRPEERQDDGLYLLNLSTREWTRVKTLGRAPEGRYGHAAAMVGSRFFVFGGQTDDGGFRNDLGWFDLQKLKAGQPRWSFIDYAPNQVVPPPRTGHTCVTYGDSLYIFGGTDGSYHYNDTWQYDLTTGQWTELACIGYIPVPREGHAATLVDDVMYVFGGRGVDGKDLEDLAAFKISNHRWFMFQNMGPAPSGRSGHAMATWQTKVLVLGGESYTSQRADDPTVVHVLDTTKIKYPPDSSRPAQQQQQAPPPSQLPPSGIPAPSSLSNLANTNGGQQRKSSIPVSPDLRDRAASPTGSARGLKSSLQGGVPPAAAQAAAGSIGQMMLNGSSSAPTNVNGTGSASPPGSIGRSGIPTPSSPTGGSKIAKRATTSHIGGAPPTRPARPDDAEAFSAGTVPPPPPVGQGQGQGGDRAKSPTRKSVVVPRAADVNLRGGAGGAAEGAGGGSPQMASLSGFAAQQAQQQQQGEPRDFNPSSPSHLQQQQQQQQAAPADAFYYSSSSSASPPSAAPPAQLSAEQEAAHRRDVEEKDAKIAELEKREKWIVAALRSAREKGYVPEEGGEGGEEAERLMAQGYEVDGEEQREKERRVVQLVVAMKGELAKAKSLMADQAAALDERFQGAERARSAALQEAAYYRAKLAAFEASSSSSPVAGSSSDSISKLERERAAELEQKLSDALSSRAELEAQVARLEQDLAHQSTLRSSADEQHKAVASRADAAEQSHARALADFADLQKRSHGHERTIADHVEKLASLTSAHAILEADNQRYKSQVEEHESSLAGYLRTLEASQEALTAAQARNDELSRVYEKATGELTSQQLKVAELETKVEQLQRERDAATAKVEELETVLKSTKEAHDKAHALANGGLAELLAAHKERQALRNVGRSRSVGGEDGEENGVADDVEDDLRAHRAERLRAVEGEVSTVRQLHSDAQAKSDALAAELETVRAREIDLHHQITTLRSQLATVQEQHARATEELGTHKAKVVEQEQRARNVSRAKDAAEVKAGLLRSLLVDHGLAAPSEDELEAKFAPLNGDEDADQLARRVQELEARLESVGRQKEQLEERVSGHEGEAERLREEVERAKAASRQGAEGEERERREAEKVREELEGLQGRHQQLEATHLKAVQYVKGTEKMLRRMKEELTRYKERCEELESPERQAELDSLRQQAESSSRQHDDLQQRMAQLQSEYQQTLREQQQEAQSKVQELTSEIGKLDQELEKAHHDLEETLAVNASLNKELQSALKNPSSPRSAGNASSEDVARLQAELEQATNKAEWLKRENASLEQRCRTAESKIAILLDHMESVQNDPYDQQQQQGSPHLNQVHNGSPGQQHQHEWERRDSVVSDAASEYDDQPQRR